MLVTAFERLTQPQDLPGGDADDDAAMGGGRGGRTKQQGPATAKLSRSNEGCERTAVHCPRCKQAWGAAVEVRPYMGGGFPWS